METQKAPCGLTWPAFMALSQAVANANVSMRELDVALEIRDWLKAQADALPKG